jgi:hypothetical protein
MTKIFWIVSKIFYIFATIKITMIVKILKPSRSFGGVLYSELKVRDNQASFIGAFNFPFESINVDDYISFFEKTVSMHPRSINNAQFHVIISTKGREHDNSFLERTAHQWLVKMGYGQQPYLIYFHNDTDNNHVHIVSCRVTEQGTRISPAFEGIRAVKALNEVMNIDFKVKADEDIKTILGAYSFSTIAQCKLLFEKNGWIVQDKGNSICLIKGGLLQGQIEKTDIQKVTNSYSGDNERIKQLRAIFFKYRGIQEEQFFELMKSKFGVDIVLHVAKGHNKPYGYTVIDRSQKKVFKGSEIMRLQDLLHPARQIDKQIIINELFNSYIRNKEATYSGLKREMHKAGFMIKGKGIFIPGDGSPLFLLSDTLYKGLRYNDRLNEATLFHPQTKNEARVLARLFFVKANDIELKTESAVDYNYYRDMLGSFHNLVEIQKYLEDNHLALIHIRGREYIIDFTNHAIADVTGYSQFGNNAGVELDMLEEQYRTDYGNLFETGAESGIFIVESLLDALAHEHPEEREREVNHRKKQDKRKR